MNILTSLLSNSGYVIVNKEIIKKLGLHEAIILGELCSEYTYWEKNNKLEDGFFFSTRDNIEENTGLSAYQQRESFRKLVEMGIVIEKLKGMPQQKWYSLNIDRIYKLFCEDTGLIASSEKTKELDVKKLDNKTERNLTPSSKENEEHDIKKLHTNNNNNNNKNINNKDEIKKFKDKVFMTDKNYQDLINKYGFTRVDKTITRLDLYKKSSGKNYSDDYSTLLLWIDEDIEKAKRDRKNSMGNEYEATIRFENLKAKFGENLEGLYANFNETTNN